MTPKELEKLALAIGRKVLFAQKEVLTLEEVAQYTGLKKSYLYKLTASKAIPHYKPNGKNCFFKRTELEDWLTTNPVATAADLTASAQAYCMTKKPTL
jgi:excisionase family DNA binding protein|nr:MAG TPA: helix-turn-helix domain protein [Caudoviricetes sp.]